MITTTIENAPDFVKDNEHIKFGHREIMTAKCAIATAFGWHNETLNIWSHFIATAIFVWFLFMSLSDWPTLVFVCAAIFLFATSTLFHLFLCVSKPVYEAFRKMDFIAISLLMWSMFVPFCFYSFDLIPRVVYLALATMTSVGCIVVCMMPIFQENEFHVYRPVVFGCLGLLGAVATIHGCIITQNVTVALYCGLQLVACFIGACFYACKWPERYYTTQFASHAGSHVIFHIFIAVGIVFYYLAMHSLQKSY